MTSYVVIFILLNLVTTDGAFNQKNPHYTQPVNLGTLMIMPWDIANITNRPRAPIISLVLMCSVALILFFGVITSPFGYFFGIPSRKYVLEKQQGRSFAQNLNTTNIDVVKSVFFTFIPHEDNDDCQSLLICEAHRVVHRVPKYVLSIYRIFSQNMPPTSTSTTEAILTGMSSTDATDDKCSVKYAGCKKSLFNIVISSFAQMMPKWTRKKLSRRS